MRDVLWVTEWRYSVQDQMYLLRCPACGVQWWESPVQIVGPHALVFEEVEVATGCPNCGQNVNVSLPYEPVKPDGTAA